MIDAADRRRKTGRAPARYATNRAKRFAREALLRVWRRGPVLLAVAAVAACGWAAAWYGTNAERFRVDEVLVNRCEHVPRAVLMDKIRIPGGQSIFRVDLERIRKRLERESWIAEAHVRRSMPDRILIQVVEHRPVAMVRLENGFYYLDARGRIFKRVGRGEPMDYPIVTGLTRRDIVDGPDADTVLAQALELASIASDRSAAFGGLSEVRVGPLGDFTIVTDREGLVVRLGKGGFGEKIERLGILLAALGSKRRRVARIDMGVDGQAVVRMTSSARGEG